MSQTKKESLLKEVLKIFVVGFIGLTALGWIEAKVRGNQSDNVDNYGHEIVKLVADKNTVNNKNDQGETALHIAVKEKTDN